LEKNYNIGNKRCFLAEEDLFGNFKGELQKKKSIVTSYEEENIADTSNQVEEGTIDLYEHDKISDIGGTDEKDDIETIFDSKEGNIGRT
jgi:hypothetical protein